MRGVITASHTFILIIKPAEQPQTDEFIASYRVEMIYDAEQHDTVARAFIARVNYFIVRQLSWPARYLHARATAARAMAAVSG